MSSPTSFEFDSGSFTLWTKAAEYAKENKCGRWDFYDTPEFYAYVDAYAAFVQQYDIAIDVYANIDVIPNPELTWRNQKLLEAKGLSPIPVVHYTEDLQWLEFYIKKGYPFIALGGLVGSTTQDACRGWIDRAFEIVCDTPDHMPRVKIHGFGITSYDLLLRYPWFSVDSTSWTKIAAFGGIMVPHKRGGKFVFTEPPYIMKVSLDCPQRARRKQHILTLSRAENGIVRDWLAHINIPLGRRDWEGNVLEYGVMTRHSERKAANLLFFEEMCKGLPRYPWPFYLKRNRKGFGFTT